MKLLNPLRVCGRVMWLVVLILISQACAPERSTTVISGSWKDPEAKKYKSFFVVVLNKKAAVRGTLETDIAKLLKKQSIEATRSLDVLGEDEKLETTEEKHAAVQKIQGLGYDAIIAVSVLRSTEESRYVKGTTQYAPANFGVGSGYYNPATGANAGGAGMNAFGTYYVGGSSLYNTPGYYEESKVYFVQTNVFEATTAKLIWSAQSETFYPGNLGAASRDFAIGMVQAMTEAGILVKQD